MPNIDRTNYNALVNDDGSNTIGTVFDKVDVKDVILDPVETALVRIHAPVVTLYPGPILVGPDGIAVTTAGTTTSGLQEAMNYAHTNSYDLKVVGGFGSIYSVNGGVSLNVPVLEESSVWEIDASINFGGGGGDTTAALVFDSMMSSTFIMNGRVISGRTSAAVTFAPRTALAGTGLKICTASDVRLSVIAGSVLTSSVTFDFSAGSCVGVLFMRISGDEWNGGSVAGVDVPTVPSGANFYMNQIRCPFIHGMTGTGWGIKNGHGAPVGGGGRNVWLCNINGATNAQGFDTYHTHDQYIGNILVDAAKVAVQFEANAAHNTITLGELVGTVTDSATLHTNVVDNYKTTTSTVSTTGNITALAKPTGAGPITTYLTNASLTTIQGMVDGYDGQIWTLISQGAGQVDLPHQNGSGTALGKLFNVLTNGASSLAPGSGSVTYRYDLANTRWNMISHEQGAVIAFTPTLTFGGGATGLTYGTQIGRYIVRGRAVWFSLRVVLTAKGSSVGAALVNGLPFTANASSSNAIAAAVNNMNAALIQTPAVTVVTSTTTISPSQMVAGSNTALADTDFTNTSIVNVCGTYEAA